MNLILAEMIGFEKQSLIGGGQSPPFPDDILSEIQRGRYSTFSIPLNAIYVPPSLTMYTKLSLKSYFMLFWIILIIQTIAIMILDHFWLQIIPKNATVLERVMHAHLKSHFPFPYDDWDAGKGSSQDHLRRQKAAQREVILTTCVNLSFSLIFLCPLIVLCEYINS